MPRIMDSQDIQNYESAMNRAQEKANNMDCRVWIISHNNGRYLDFQLYTGSVPLVDGNTEVIERLVYPSLTKQEV